MTIYRYTALNKAGHTVKGSLEVEDEHILYTTLKERGLLLQEAFSERKIFKRRQKVRQEDMIEFSHQMGFIVESGIPFIQGLNDIQKSLKEPTLKATLEAVSQDLSAGDSLSQSLTHYPHIFSPAYVAVVNAGESSGNLVEAFRDIARYLEWSLNLKRQVKQALTYPIIVMILLSIAMGIFVSYVVPKLVKFILELDRPIPLPTRVLIFFNQFLLNWWPLLLGVFIFLIIALIIGMRFERCRFLWDQYKLKIPKAGELFQDLMLVRFVNYLRILYRSGIQIHQSFTILRGVVGNRFFQQKIDHIRDLIMGGESLADSMEKVGGFPPILERSFRVGEKTGALEGTLEQLGAFLDRQINANVRKITTLLEPLLLMFVGIALIFIILSVIWPIYGILGEIG